VNLDREVVVVGFGDRGRRQRPARAIEHAGAGIQRVRGGFPPRSGWIPFASSIEPPTAISASHVALFAFSNTHRR
jgi:hypothetical protein